MALVFTPFEISRHVASGLRREGKQDMEDKTPDLNVR